MIKKDNHSFFCHKKRCRKTAWDTPEYLTEADWANCRKLLRATTGLDYAVTILEAFEDGTAEGLFYRILGWPEGMHYCRSTSFIESSAWPGFVQHEQNRLRLAVDRHIGLFD